MSWAAAAQGAMKMMSSQGGKGGGMGGLMGGGGESGPTQISAPNMQTKQERNQDIASKSGMSPKNTKLGGVF